MEKANPIEATNGAELHGIRKILGANLTRLRGSEPRDTFAARLGISSASALRRWELGEVAAPFDAVARIAGKLGVPLTELFQPPIEAGQDSAAAKPRPTAALEASTVYALQSMVAGISATELVDRLARVVDDETVDIHDRGRACLDIIRAWRLDLEAEADARDETATEKEPPPTAAEGVDQ